MNKKEKGEKKIELSRVEQAIVYLAEMCQDPMHDQFRLKAHVLDILGKENNK